MTAFFKGLICTLGIAASGGLALGGYALNKLNSNFSGVSSGQEQARIPQESRPSVTKERRRNSNLESENWKDFPPFSSSNNNERELLLDIWGY